MFSSTIAPPLIPFYGSCVLSDNGEPLFKPLRSRRLFEEVCDQIRSQIADGKLKPGDKLPAERDLATQFGISRSGVREALRSLEFAGLVKLEKGVKGGSFVLGSEHGLVQTLESMFDIGHVSIKEIMTARIEIMDTIVKFAAENGKESHFKALEADIKRTKRHMEDPDGSNDPLTTQEFYTVLAQATGNRIFVMMAKALSQLVYKALQSHPPRMDFDLVGMRTKFVAQLRARNVSAARKTMRDYLAFLHKYLEDRYKP